MSIEYNQIMIWSKLWTKLFFNYFLIFTYSSSQKNLDYIIWLKVSEVITNWISNVSLIQIWREITTIKCAKLSIWILQVPIKSLNFESLLKKEEHVSEVLSLDTNHLNQAREIQGRVQKLTLLYRKVRNDFFFFEMTMISFLDLTKYHSEYKKKCYSM